MSERRYYVYIHRRAHDNQPFYVGKGCLLRAYERSGRNKYWKRVAAKYGWNVEIVFDNMTEEEAFQGEKDTILELTYFGSPLTNLTDGGEGSSGLKFSDQQRLNITLGTRKRFDYKQPEPRRPTAYGINNHNADKTEYDFVRLSDGFEITCTRSYLCSEYNVRRDLIKKLFYAKNARKSADEWRLKGLNDKSNTEVN